MARKVAVLFVHGINNHDQEFHRPMQERLVRALPRRLRDYVDFEPAIWSQVVRRHQRAYMTELESRALVHNNKYRRMALQGLGDAAAYQKTRDWRNSSYYQIQSEVRAAIDRLDQRGEPTRPLIFIGHSLGCHILSSFAWDTYSMRRWDGERLAREDDKTREFAAYLRDGSPFRRLETLAGFITMGSNMPLFTFTFGPESIVPITRARRPSDHPAFPCAALDPALKARARWINFYSRHDLLGYPLKPLSSHYRDEPRLSDVAVVSEGWWRRILFAPAPALSAYAAHVGYWTHPKVIRQTADLISDLVTADEPVAVPRFVFGRRRASITPSRSEPAVAGKEPSSIS
jgi:hypothetical protein